MRLTLLVVLVVAALLILSRLRPSPPAGVPSTSTTSTAPSAAPTPPAPSGPLSPAEEFRRIGEEMYAGQCPQYGRAPREAFEAQLADPVLPDDKRVSLQVDLAGEYLKAGEVPRAIEVLESARKRAESGGDPQLLRKVVQNLGQAWLREAENQNCIQRHNAECCIFPPREGAKHTLRQPAEQARKMFRAVLADNPDSLGARWLVNLTTLLLGESTDDLPQNERIPARALGEVKGEPLFHDVGAEAGVDASSLAGGVAVEDFDGDGLLDVMTSTCDPRGPMHYFHSHGDGTFEDRSEASGVSDQLGGLNMVSADYDGDGDQDPMVLRGGWLLDYGCIRRSLLRNDGHEHFEDVTRAAGLAEPAYPSMAVAFGDFDGDGHLDFYSGNESRVEIEQGHGDYPSQLFHNRGDGTFVDVAAAAGVRNDRYA
jgi:hypothetical protein